MRDSKYLLYVLIVFSTYSCSKREFVDNPTPQPSLGHLFNYTSISWMTQSLQSINLDNQKVEWKTRLAFSSGAPPCYDSGSLYTSNPIGISALNAINGEVLWDLSYSYYGYFNPGAAYVCTPVVADSFVYTLGYSGYYGSIAIYAIHKKKGAIIWKKVVSENSASNIGQPLINKEKLIFTGRGYNGRHVLICLNRFSGNVIWERNLSTDNLFPSGFPESDNERVYVNDISIGKVFGFDINTGKMIWTANIERRVHPHQRLKLFGDYLIAYIGHPNATSTVYCFNKKTGEIVNQYFQDTAVISLSADQQGVYIVNYGSLHLKDFASNKIFWNRGRPIKAYHDSAEFDKCVSQYPSWTIMTDKEIIFYDIMECFSPLARCVYNRMVFVEKKTGKITREVNCEKINDCEALYNQFVFVQEGKAYYPNAAEY